MSARALTADLVSNGETPLSTAQWTVKLGDGGLADPELPEQTVELLKTRGIPATVPGNVYDSLLSAGLIPDPFIGTNEHDLHWIGRQEWVYSAKLPDHPESDHYNLVFYGLDTIAEVRLGGVVVGSTKNMHRTYDFDVTDAILAGAEDIEISFTSPYSFTDRVSEELGVYPGSYDEPYNLIRKMACNYGWDWGPTVVTSGPWRDGVLLGWDKARFVSTRISAGAELRSSLTGIGTVTVQGRIEVDPRLSPTNFKVRVSVSGEESSPVDTNMEISADGTFTAAVSVSDARIWWPHTLGDQPLYDVNVELVSSEDQVLDSRFERVGFRTVELVNDPCLEPEKAAQEGRFGLIINGRDTFARGWNWIPNDPLVDRVTEESYRARLIDVRDSGADWVRVWGGGIFEDDVFYDICDELGILVWQDFPFACASYPETPEWEEEVRAESADNVERLMSHPSLGVWNGNNENFMGYESWGWKDQLGDRGWGAKYYLETIPEVVSTVDPTRPYWPGSPYSGVPGQMDANPNYGTCHSWEVWNRQDYVHYLDSDPTFMAEFGWQSPPAWSTLVRAVDVPAGVTELDLTSPEVMNHQKAMEGMDKLERGVVEHFGSEALSSTAAWHYLTQIVQARAIATGVGHWRSLWPRCQGAFIWQINDCWPVISWAGVDADGHRKPMWYTARAMFADRMFTLKEIEGRLVAFLVNQTDEPWETNLSERVVNVAGNTIQQEDRAVSIPASSVKTIELSVTVSSPRQEVAVVDAEDQREVWIGVPDYDFSYPLPTYVGRFEAVPNADQPEFTLDIHAESLLRELILQADRIHPALVASSEAVTLLPGENHKWVITVRPGATEEETTDAIMALEEADWSFPVLSSIGDVLATED
ncbi:hypothetical protein U6G28_01480 [Actinomycetaceae bacterium MB13-C1-2]|nr:hypothetical protein U6G28_01480 [Actinomycetaceae bacterium MB13-C1-2]